ncbi:hypothetical protein J1N35_025403 [Gossypium stocksii]|uniref:Uncharacterized protein n=1 Tax=Gossypium stocksii TaxID=47602 RepID=A0A9D3V6H3_9ROSI|nr:hypothetical protein J1N35_025403 [Gossypium stocksii]
MENTQELQTLYWFYLRTRDIALKRSLQKNFTGPIFDFLAFPKELLPLLEASCAERKPIEVLSEKEESTTKEDKAEKGQASEEDPEKTKSLTIERKSSCISKFNELRLDKRHITLSEGCSEDRKLAMFDELDNAITSSEVY